MALSDSDQAGLPKQTIIGVAGAGRMGAGIAAVAAAAGHSILLYDAFEGAARRGRDGIAADYEGLIKRGKLTAEEAQLRLDRIRPVASPEDLAPAGMVIEAIVEDLNVKAELFGRIEAVTAPETIMATNTSSLSIAALAGRLKRPHRLAGFHFFNPAPVMPLVEVIGTTATDAAVVELLVQTARDWGKSPVRCAATPGFIVNRVARPFYGESMRLLSERAADVQTLDAIMRDSGGFRMGAFELTDMIGHDVNYAVTVSVYDAFFQDPRYRPSLVQKALVEAGSLGRKTKRGFYDYADSAAAPIVAEAAVGPKPQGIIARGDLGPASALLDLAEQAGVSVTRTEGSGEIVCGPVVLALTDGRTATSRSAASGECMVLFDLAGDFAAAKRIAIAAPDGATDDQRAVAAGFFQALGKVVSPIDDAPGLLVMRTVAMLANEALDVVHQDVAQSADVDLAMVKGAGYPTGPLAMGQKAGASLVLRVLENLAVAYPEGRYRPSPLLRRAAAGGRALTAL